MGKNNKQQPLKQFQRFGIRKFTQGVASVMIASGMFFLAGGMVSANEAVVEEKVTTEKDKAEVKPAAAQDAKEEAAQPVETPALDKTQLVSYIATLETNISSGKYDSKTDESVANLKAEVEVAKSVVVNAKTQEDLTKAYNKLVTTAATKLVSKPVKEKETPAVDTTNGQPTVGKKAENTEPKAGTNSIENTGSKDSRNGKALDTNNAFRADLAEKVDEAPLTEAEQGDHWKKYREKNTERLKHQIKWFDITSKTAVVENLGEGGKLKVGTKFKQELTPGYVVEMEVTALKPFNSTDVYKERGGAGYDPNAQNVYKDGTPAEVKVVRQGGYSVVKTNGIDTGGTTVIQSVKNGANVGVEFKVKATLNGKEVPANVVFATGEEAGSSEIEIYKTDGDGFELVTELSNTNYRVPTARSYTAESYDNRYNLTPVANGQGRQLGQSYSIEGSGKPAFAPFIADKAKGFRSTEITEETVSTVTDKDGTVYSDGLGTQVFGPAVTHRDSGMSTPVVLTRNAKNLGVYILSSGQQGAMFGFMVLDEGDAPASYGKVGHAIAKGAGITQPYLGSKEPDIDIRTEKITDETAFKYDDVNGEGEDEGARQLMGDKVAQGDNYKLKKVNDGTYSMTFDAHLGGGKNAFVNGWIDFNNNGKFDENEGAGAVEVTKDGEVTLTWTTPVQNVDVTATKLATRLRIANDKADVKEATGIAYSGEVEDFQIQQTIPPRGTKEETYDVQGATQRSTVKFTAYGNQDYNFEEKATIDEAVKPQIVKADGTIVTDAELVDGYYVVPGQGKYKVTAKGKDVNVEFVPEATFVGDADGITIRRTDTNGATIGWGKIGKPIVNGEGDNGDQLTLISEQVTPEGATEKGSMDGRYIPHVMKREIENGTEKSNDIQGAKQTKTPEFKDTAGNKITPSEEYPVKLIDPKTGKTTEETEIPATKDGKTIGTYTITPATGEVVFTPNKDFTGEPDPVTVSFTGKVGVDKNGNPVTSTGIVTYQPKVKPVTPTAEGGETTKPQGETQEQEITFTAGKNTVTYLDKNDNPVEVEKSVPMNPDAYTLLGEDGQPATEVPAKKPDGTVIGTYTLKVVDGVPTAVFTPTDKTYVGDVLPVTIQGEDENGTKATAKYTPHITPVEPTAKEAESTAKQGDTQKGKPTFTPGSETSTMKPETLTLVDDSGNPVETLPATDKKGNKVGDYTVDKTTGEVIFTPTDKTYAGEVLPARVRMQDSNGTPAETNYTPNIVPVRPQGQPAESKAPQGQTQEGTVSFTGGTVTVNGKEETVAIQEGTARLLDQNGNPLEPTAKQDVMGPDGNKIGEYSIDPTTNKVTYTPTDLQYTGKVPAAVVQALDVNGTPAVTTYTPSIIPETPTAEEATSIKPQGQVQKGTVTFTAGSELTPIVKSKTTLLDENNQPAEEVPAKSPEGKVIGKYTLNKDTGEVTFTPDPTVPYAGDVVPVTVRGEDTNGSQVTTTYTPSIIPVNPSANPAKSEGPQGVEQTGTVEFIPGNPNKEPESPAPINKSTITLLDNSGNLAETVTVTKDGKEIGVYSLVKDGNGVPTGEVKFTPTDKTYVGEVEPVTVQAKDTNSTVAKTTYTPKFTGVTPTGTPVESTGIQGKTQEGTPTFTPGDDKVPMKIDETQPATFYNPVTKEPIAETEVPATKDGKEVGKYTIDPKSGKVTFTPNKDFTGTPDPATVQAKDANGTPTTATYTPTVTPVTPSGKDAESTGIQGKTQEGTPKFTEGNPEVPITITDEQPAQFVVDGKPVTEKEIPAKNKDGKVVGKYTIDPKSGKVTFTPNKDFVGTLVPATVQVKDANGTPTTATYTPTVTGVTPTAEGVTSEGAKGQVQTGKPTFKEGNTEVPMDDEVPATFEDGSTVKTVEGVGKFEVAKDGTVTFTPEKSFTGKAPAVTVKRVDKNGTEAKATYTPTVRPDTKFVVVGKDGKETELIPSKDGKQPEEKIAGYKVVKTETDEKGNTKHIYEKVTTSFKDKEGNIIPNYPTEEGTTPKKDNIPGYRFVETKKLPNGDTEHVYEKVKTSFKDKEGKEIPNYPTEDGDQPKKDIPGYRFVETKKLPNGDVEHIYEKVKTSFKDKEGNVIPGYPTEDGDQPKKDIPGYRFVETKKLPNGDIEHIYEKVVTPTPTPTPFEYKVITTYVDENGELIIPKENGEQPSKKLSGYELVKTEKDANGNVRHVYRKVTTPETSIITTFVDENGNPILPKENGEVPAKEIPGYELVRTEKDANGNVRHIYRKVVTPKEDVKSTPAPQEKVTRQELPNTGTGSEFEIFGVAASAILAGLGLTSSTKKKKED